MRRTKQRATITTNNPSSHKRSLVSAMSIAWSCRREPILSPSRKSYFARRLLWSRWQQASKNYLRRQSVPHRATNINASMKLLAVILAVALLTSCAHVAKHYNSPDHAKLDEASGRLNAAVVELKT